MAFAISNQLSMVFLNDKLPPNHEPIIVNQESALKMAQQSVKRI